MSLQKIIIEDVSDCETCTEREFCLFEFMAEHKFSLLTDAVCPECGRSFDLVIEESDDA